MLGVIIILVVLFAALPLTFFAIGTFISVVLGHVLRTEGEHMNEGSELIELNV